jgi:hypothetical protein
MTDNNSWLAIAAKFAIVFVLLILVALLSHCNNNDKRDRCEAKGGQFIQNDYDSSLSSCVLPRRWN